MLLKKIAIFCIGMLLMVALGCGGSRDTVKYPANTPEGVAQAYYQALKDGKPDLAYQYKKFNSPKTKEQFVTERKNAGMTFQEFTVGKSTITGTTATVPVTFKTGNSAMPELTMNVQLVKDKNWLISDTGLGGQAGHGTSSPPSGMPPAGSAPPAGSMPPATGANPHGAGGSIPLNQ